MPRSSCSYPPHLHPVSLTPLCWTSLSGSRILTNFHNDPESHRLLHRAHPKRSTCGRIEEVTTVHSCSISLVGLLIILITQQERQDAQRFRFRDEGGLFALKYLWYPVPAAVISSFSVFPTNVHTRHHHHLTPHAPLNPPLTWPQSICGLVCV